MSLTSPPKALLFDVFGTVVDWRSTVTSALIAASTKALNAPTTSLSSTLRLRASSLTPEDWATLAQEWRISYMIFTRNHDPKSTFISVDQHHYDALKKLLQKWELEGLWTEAEIKQLSLIWHYLDPWPDSSKGLAELNKKFETCTLSNGNVSLLKDMAEHAKLPWKHVFSGETFKAYKPSPLVYNGGAKELDLETKECAMVAAHIGDLKAAKGCGMQTIFVERAQEDSEVDSRKAKEEGWVDMMVSLEEDGLLEVARRFGIK